MEMTKTQLALVLLSVACFLLSLAMPAFRFTPDDPWFKFSSANDYWPGILVLLLGWIGIFEGVIAWLANPLWVMALLQIGTHKYRLSTTTSVMAICCAVSAFFITQVPNEKRPFYSLGIGFYVWLVSILILVVVSVVGSRMTFRPAREA